VKRLITFRVLASLMAIWPAVAVAQSQREDEIVASLSGGRVIIQIAKDDVILFGAIDQPAEAGSAPPRVLQLDDAHVGILFGATEWQKPADPKPIRLDRDFRPVQAVDQHYQEYTDVGERDLETIGIGFLEELRPLVAQLHHKFSFGAEEALVEVIIVGFGQRGYGPEVWQLEYRITQEQVAARGEYWQTRVLRPRFTQLYPPEGGKKGPHTLVEARYPAETANDAGAVQSKDQRANGDPPLIALIQGADPRIAKLESSNPKFTKEAQAIEKGQAQKVESADAADFLRAALPLMANGSKFFLGSMEEQKGFDWIVPPDEPVKKEPADKDKADDKDKQPYVPSLRKKPTP
jgi:hypothetical protein